MGEAVGRDNLRFEYAIGRVASASWLAHLANVASQSGHQGGFARQLPSSKKAQGAFKKLSQALRRRVAPGRAQRLTHGRLRRRLKTYVGASLAPPGAIHKPKHIGF